MAGYEPQLMDERYETAVIVFIEGGRKMDYKNDFALVLVCYLSLAIIVVCAMRIGYC